MWPWNLLEASAPPTLLWCWWCGLFLLQAEVKAMTQEHCWLPDGPRARKPLPDGGQRRPECWVERGLVKRPELYQSG